MEEQHLIYENEDLRKQLKQDWEMILYMSKVFDWVEDRLQGVQQSLEEKRKRMPTGDQRQP